VLVDGNKDQLARIKCAARTAGVEITLVLDLVQAPRTGCHHGQAR
jgi:hypothetical protein